MATKTKPIRRISYHSYFGGKTMISRSLISPRIPKGIKTYVEPFSGSFAVYFQTDFEDETKIVFNDFNKDQVNLFHCTKDYEKMLNNIKYHLEDVNGLLFCSETDDDKTKEHYKKLYYDTKKSGFSTNQFDLGDYDRATMYSFMLTSAFNSCFYMAAGFSSGKKKIKIHTLINKLNNEYIRLKFDNISHIENMDFEDVIKKYDSPDTFCYIDAPYMQDEGLAAKSHDRLKWYGVEKEGEFGPSSHKRLCDLLKTTQCKWAVSYYDFPELSKWLPKDEYKWTSLDFFRSSAAFSDKKDKKGTELLIMNYDIPEEEYKSNYLKYNGSLPETINTPSEDVPDNIVVDDDGEILDW